MKYQTIQKTEYPGSLINLFLFAVGLLKKITLIGILFLIISQFIHAQPIGDENKNMDSKIQPEGYFMQTETYYQNGIVYMNWVENTYNQKTYQNAIWVSKQDGDFLSLEISKDNKEFSLLGMTSLNKLSNKMNILSKDGSYYNGKVFFKFSLFDAMNKKIAETTVDVQFRGQKEVYGFYENYNSINVNVQERR